MVTVVGLCSGGLCGSGGSLSGGGRSGSVSGGVVGGFGLSVLGGLFLNLLDGLGIVVAREFGGYCRAGYADGGGSGHHCGLTCNVALVVLVVLVGVKFFGIHNFEFFELLFVLFVMQRYVRRDGFCKFFPGFWTNLWVFWTKLHFSRPVHPFQRGYRHGGAFSRTKQSEGED